jgi:tetratricopeptide (TPR) repeat protein
MKPHAFVAMPYGAKPSADGSLIDFNCVYRDYIKPAVEMAGLEVFRADEEQQAGSILRDMFQELLIADLVIADLTIDNPNVWYELGVRHGVRARGVVLVCGGRVTTAFDLYTDRKLRYGLKGGRPDPSTLEADKTALAAMVRETMASWHGRKTSPVYYQLPNLQEPDWKSLRIGDVSEFWEQHDAWERRIDLARKAERIGDLLLLAEEAPVAAFRAEAWITVGKALRGAKRFDYALEQLERGLAIAPNNLGGLREKGICLQRLAMQKKSGYSLDKARDHYRTVLKNQPDDSETWALLGRVDKDAWVESWQQTDQSSSAMRDQATHEDALLKIAIDSYHEGYRRNPGHYYSGINALTLMHLYKDLTGDPSYDAELDALAGAVRFAATNERDERQRFWSKATLGDLEVLLGQKKTITAAYNAAIACAENDWFALDSSRSQLLLLKDLGFRPEAVQAGIVTFDRALQRLARPADRWQPRQVLLFSGHMIDEPGRTPPRFPAEKVEVARHVIAVTLEKLGAGKDDLALTQGACGGDLLFSEECLKRGVQVQWLQPFEEPKFVEKSVARGGADWRNRYYAAKQQLPSNFPPRAAPIELGAIPDNADDDYPYERCNLWLLYTALSFGIEKVRFIALWDGGGGDGPGGTAHMHHEVKNRTGRVHWLNTRELW